MSRHGRGTWRWLIDPFGELRRVTWPSPLTAAQNALVVSIVIVACLVLIGGVDLGAHELLSRVR
ncbi:MAG TPA: preprotein translocase subunit SecE [Acidimicrobiales bacterium]|nr:preprotein translocase subunit SecE [Acidimicrobiales bacterium]